MAWWIWGVIGWATMTTFAVVYLAAVCAGRRRRSEDPDSVPEDGWLPGFVDEAPEGTAPPEAAASRASVPAQGARQGASPLPSPSTQPLTRLLPGDGGEEASWGMVPHPILGRLVEGARTGSYTLPERLVYVHRAGRLLRELDLPAPVHFGRDEAAARLVSAATDSRPLDPMGLCAEMHRSRTDRLLYQEALEILKTAAGRAEGEAMREAAETCDAIIAEHLRPAYLEVLHRARDVARRLGPYIDDRFQLDTPRIITASLKIRNAYLALPGLVREHSRILAAREWANALGQRTPECDRRGLFSVFENPFVFAAASGLPYDDIPMPRLPDDGTTCLLWMVSDQGDPGRPWLPSAAEQDAAWRRHFSRPSQAMSSAAAD
jgi:hypothetical protein